MNKPTDEKNQERLHRKVKTTISTIETVNKVNKSIKITINSQFSWFIIVTRRGIVFKPEFDKVCGHYRYRMLYIVTTLFAAFHNSKIKHLSPL